MARQNPQPEPDQRAIAFFDLDRTLLDAHSGLMLVQYEHRLGRLSLPKLIRSTIWSGLHHLSLLDAEKAYREGAQHWRGLYGPAIKNEIERWFATEMAWRLRPGGARTLDHHRDRGDLLVLLTGSSAYIAEAACSTWQMDDFLANPVILDASGRLTGELEFPLCYGAGKVERARRWATAQGLSMAGAHFYTDSSSDLPMLNAVDHPRVVHPDPKLRFIARRRGWPVEDWSISQP